MRLKELTLCAVVLASPLVLAEDNPVAANSDLQAAVRFVNKADTRIGNGNTRGSLRSLNRADASLDQAERNGADPAQVAKLRSQIADIRNDVRTGDFAGAQSGVNTLQSGAVDLLLDYQNELMQRAIDQVGTICNGLPGQ